MVICCYTVERLNDIHEAAESVLTQTVRPHELIIAVDHNEELLQKLKAELPTEVKVLLNEGVQGLSETRNVGIRASSGDIVAFIDDDAVAEEDWTENLIRPFENPNVMAVGGRTIPRWPNGRRHGWFPEELDWIVGCNYKGPPLKENEIRNVLGCNMAFRKGVFDKTGLFRSETGRVGATSGCGEEADLCLRISRSVPGARIVYQEKATVSHKVAAQRMTWRYLWKRSYDEGSYKRLVKGLSSGLSRNALSTEESYLRYLLFKSIPATLARCYRGGSLPEAAAIIVCIAATGAGYWVGKVRG